MGKEPESLYSGFASTGSLGDLFALWTKDRGALSNWPDARRFGEFVARYSDLRTLVVAVWLDLDQDALSAPLPPEEMFGITRINTDSL